MAPVQLESPVPTLGAVYPESFVHCVSGWENSGPCRCVPTHRHHTYHGLANYPLLASTCSRSFRCA